MKLKSKILILGILLTLPSQLCKGQVPAFSDQFLVNNFLINPAIAGTSLQSPLTLSIRRQWMGIATAPVYQTISYHKSMVEKGRRFNQRGFLNRGENTFAKVGLGGGLFNFKYGAVTQLGVHLDYAYHVFLDNGRLSFGLAPLYQQFSINTGDFIRPDGDKTDPLLDGTKEVSRYFDASVGINYQSKSVFGGASIIELFNSRVRFGSKILNPAGDANHNYYLARTVYAYGGISPALGKHFILKPSVMVKYSEPTGIRFQANVVISYDDYIESGLLYRFQESAGFFLGIKALRVLIRYQFEYPLGAVTGINFLTNQILVGYLL